MDDKLMQRIPTILFSLLAQEILEGEEGLVEERLELFVEGFYGSVFGCICLNVIDREEGWLGDGWPEGADFFAAGETEDVDSPDFGGKVVECGPSFVLQQFGEVGFNGAHAGSVLTAVEFVV